MDADRPAHSVHTLTDVELRDYERELEHSSRRSRDPLRCGFGSVVTRGVAPVG
jgi:hypothetical protein